MSKRGKSQSRLSILKQSFDITKISFGGASSIITSLALITSFDVSERAKVGVTGSLLVIALADNVSDTLGIHIYQEGEDRKIRDIWSSSLTNFLTRLLVTVVFIFFVLAFSPSKAIVFSVLYGLVVLTIISYLIAKKRNISLFHAIFEHLAIAILVIAISKNLGSFLVSLF